MLVERDRDLALPVGGDRQAAGHVHDRARRRPGRPLARVLERRRAHEPDAPRVLRGHRRRRRHLTRETERVALRSLPEGAECDVRSSDAGRASVREIAVVEFNLADLFEHAVDHFGDAVPRLRRQAPHLRRDGGAGQPARPPPRRPRRRARRPRRHLRLQLGRVGRDAVGGVQAPRRAGSTSTTATSRTSSRYLFDNADLKALVYQREFAPGSRACSTTSRCSRTRRDRGRQRRRRRRARRRAYEDGARRAARPSATSARARRRPLHPLHRRHHRHAQGRGVAPRGRVLRPRRRHRRRHRRARVEQPEDDGREGQGAAARSTSLPIAPLMHGATQWG